jgi:hypothetical protein
MKNIQTDLLQGTLDLLVLKTLRAGPTHGWDIAQRIQQVSQGIRGKTDPENYLERKEEGDAQQAETAAARFIPQSGDGAAIG